MVSILSTKKLKPTQRDLLLDTGFSVVDYDAIEIEFLDFKMPSEIKNAIFTSKNGVSSILNSKFKIQNCFCVGQKTKALLEENGLNVTKTTDYGQDLADFITKNHKNDSFHFFCGSIRSDEIPKALNIAKIEIIEVKTYKTTLIPKKFDQKWGGILFFSPSGVASFVADNKINDSIAFCIGKTTAAEAQKHTSNVVIANTTLVESVIAKAVKTLRK